MHILLFAQITGSADECMMAVPQDYKADVVRREVADYLGTSFDNVYLVTDVELDYEPSGFSEYRPYIG